MSGRQTAPRSFVRLNWHLCGSWGYMEKEYERGWTVKRIPGKLFRTKKDEDSSGRNFEEFVQFEHYTVKISLKKREMIERHMVWLLNVHVLLWVSFYECVLKGNGDDSTVLRTFIKCIQLSNFLLLFSYDDRLPFSYLFSSSISCTHILSLVKKYFWFLFFFKRLIWSHIFGLHVSMVIATKACYWVNKDGVN